jgi:hypothetical protein
LAAIKQHMYHPLISRFSKQLKGLLALLCLGLWLPAQVPDSIYSPAIRSVRLHMYGNQFALPVYNVNSADQLELHFDDMDGSVKNYSYTYQLCDYDWKPVNISTFDYIKGFMQQRISTWRASSLAFTRYTHYQAILPDRNSVPSRSGNYLLKVFLNGDTSRLAFTRRLPVVEAKSTVGAQVIQPFAPQFFKTHQKIQFNVNTQGLNSFSAAQQVKVVIIQNNNWMTAVRNIKPTFIRNTTLEYNTENDAVFNAGKEYRWLDLRDFRLQTDRVATATYNKASTEIFLKTDMERNTQRYVYYNDVNGMYMMEAYNVNPYWQGDYATVHFSFATPDQLPYPNKEVYLTGQLTDYKFSAANKLVFNNEKKVYEATLFLKQGYYSYSYTVVDKTDGSIKDIDGSWWEAENQYTILVYYRSFTDRADQLIGVGNINSIRNRPGFSF